MLKLLYWLTVLVAALLILFMFVAAAPPPPALPASSPSVVPSSGGAFVHYLGHCGYAVQTSGHLLIFDYQETYDGRARKVLPSVRSLSDGWINPEEVKHLKVRVFVSHSHEDHFDPVIFTWKKTVRDIAYFFGWKADDDPSSHSLVGPRAELSSDGLLISTISSHHSGVPEVAWLVRTDGLAIYHNGDCLPDDPGPEHDFLKSRSARVDLAFVPPVTKPGERYTLQEKDFFRKFAVGAAFPMHFTAGDPMYRDFKRVFEAEFPGLRIQVPEKLGQKFVYDNGRVRE